MSDTPITDAAKFKLRDSNHEVVHVTVSRDLERQLAAVTKQRDTLAEFISKIRGNAISIQKIRYGWDGDRGAKKRAESIEEICDLALTKLKEKP